MAFSYTQEGNTTEKDKRYVWGTFTNGSGDTGGDIDTGLAVCEGMLLTVKGSSVDANSPVVNETFPAAGSAITIVATDNADGYWLGWGY